MTQCGNSVRYRGHASFLQGNGGSRIYSLPGSSAKHHRAVSKDFAGYIPVSGGGRDALWQRGRTTCSDPPAGESPPALPERATPNGGRNRLRLPFRKDLFCLIREIVCPCFSTEPETTAAHKIKAKIASKTCHYWPLWMDDLRPRKTPVNRGVAESTRTRGRPLRTGVSILRR